MVSRNMAVELSDGRREVADLGKAHSVLGPHLTLLEASTRLASLKAYSSGIRKAQNQSYWKNWELTRRAQKMRHIFMLICKIELFLFIYLFLILWLWQRPSCPFSLMLKLRKLSLALELVLQGHKLWNCVIGTEQSED